MKKCLMICMLSFSGLANADEVMILNDDIEPEKPNNLNFYVGAGAGVNLGVQYKLLYVGAGLQLTTKGAKRKNCYKMDNDDVVCGSNRIYNLPYDADKKAEAVGAPYFSIGMLSNMNLKRRMIFNFGGTLDLAKNGVGFSTLLQGDEWGINTGMMFGKEVSYYKGNCERFAPWSHYVYCSYESEKTTKRNYGYHFTLVRKF